MEKTEIKALLVDIGGVLLTDGWGHQSRKLAAAAFGLDLTQLNTRHRLSDATYEVGKMSLDDYLNQVVFYQKRSFSMDDFRDFMFKQSKPCTDMMLLIQMLKAKYGLKIIALSNEGREVNDNRIKQFKLDSVVDFFISSCFVRVRKPDPEIYRLALDIGQVTAGCAVYIENTPMFVQIAEGLGIKSILHKDYEGTRAKLASIGLEMAE